MSYKTEIINTLEDLKVKYVSEHDEVKPSEVIKYVVNVYKTNLHRGNSVPPDNIYSGLKNIVTYSNKESFFKPIDKIIIEELVSTIYGDKYIDYTMYNFLNTDLSVSEVKDKKQFTKIDYPKVSTMYSLENEIKIIAERLGVVGLIEYTKLFLRYCS